MPKNIMDDAKARRGLPKKAFADPNDQVRVRTDEFRHVYANNFRFNASQWDVGIIFGEIAGEKDGRAVIEEITKVSMTREMAKVLSTVLQHHLSAFEAEFGEIRIPISDEAEVVKKAGETIPETSPEEDARAKAESDVEKVKPLPG